MANWKRPDSVPIPQIWSRFEGKKPMGKDRKIPKFVVQDMTDDMIQETLDHLTAYFLSEEPILQNQKIKNDSAAVEDFQAKWRKAIDSKLALICLVENKEEFENDGLPALAGCNLTHWLHPGARPIKMTSSNAQKVSSYHLKCFRDVDCFSLYNVPGYLFSTGLSVNPVYRGQGIGLQLVQARLILAKAMGIKLIVSVFSSTESQKIGEKVGFKTIREWNYDDHKDENGEPVFKGLTESKTAKLMAARIE